MDVHQNFWVETESFRAVELYMGTVSLFIPIGKDAFQVAVLVERSRMM